MKSSSQTYEAPVLAGFVGGVEGLVFTEKNSIWPLTKTREL
ncbi:MAG: hypothetical protein ACM34H_06760 [Deltaproteobacteria bacterium]